ncbi:MAG TPA: hypothetical protein VIS06_13390, partial [Mycobacteriales bacterium]
MNVKKGAVVVTSVAALALAAAGCGAGGSADGGRSGGRGTLVYGESTDWPQNLFPLISAGNATSVSNILIRILPSPYRTYPDFTVKADTALLASEPTTTTEGGKQLVTYKLNPKAVWSDGQPIDAKDFEFTWNIQKSSDPADGGCPA